MFKKTILLLLGLCFFSIGSLYAQKTIDTLVASGYYKKADSLQKKGAYNKSSSIYKKALLVYEKEKVWKKVADCYNNISQNQWSLLKKESLINAKKALKISKNYISKNSKQEATAYSNIGSYYERIANYDSALVYHNKSLKLRQKILPRGHHHIGISYNNLAGNYYAQSKYKEALKYYTKALKIVIKTKDSDGSLEGLIYANLGAVYYSFGKLNKAIEYFKKDVAILAKNYDKNHVNFAYTYTNIGAAYHKLDQLSFALEYYQKALDIFIKNNYSAGIADIYGSIGDIWSDLGENNKALMFHQKGLSITLEIFGDKNVNTANFYSDIALGFYSKKHYKRSLFYYNKALDVYKLNLNENHSLISNIYGNIGNIYSQKKEYEVALKYYKKGQEINKIVFDKDNPEMATSHNNLGGLFLKQKSYKDALFEYQKALELVQNGYGNNHLLCSNYYTKVAIVHHKMKEYKTALDYFDKAIISNTKSKNKIADDIINPNNYFDNQLLLKIIHAKAQTLQSHYSATNSKEFLDQSIQLYKSADKIIDHLRQTFQNYQDKLALAKQSKEIYSDAIAAQLLVYKNTKDEKALYQAWYFAEKSKANTLKELLDDSNAKNFAGLATDLLSLEKTIKTDRAYYQSQIVSEQSEDSVAIAKIKDFENELFAINQREDSLLNILKKEHPKYYQLKHKNELVSVKEIQQRINNETTVLQFFTTDSITYAFTVSKKAMAVKELKTPELSDKIELLNNTIISENSKEYKKLAYSIYTELVAPIRNKIVGDQLIMIPDGPLWHLNFDLLLTQGNTEEDHRDLPYFLKKYAISYANSADLLFNPIKNNQKTSKIRDECLAFSFSDTSNSKVAKNMSLATLRDAGDDLPGTRKEIKAISDIIDGHYYYGSEASEATFKQNVGLYSMLHLAVHGQVDNEKPQNSKLYFTKSNDTIEDNFLYSHELFALTIPADLVVLSACNTGTGKIANGEGLMSLGNAFQYAGAKSLVLSRWAVPDKTTPELMKYFYTNLKKGMNKAKALQQAKLKYLNTTEAFYTNPFYWGSFYILGNTDTISIESSTNRIYLWIAGIAIFIFVILFFPLCKKYFKTSL